MSIMGAGSSVGVFEGGAGTISGESGEVLGTAGANGLALGAAAEVGRAAGPGTMFASRPGALGSCSAMLPFSWRPEETAPDSRNDPITAGEISQAGYLNFVDSGACGAG